MIQASSRQFFFRFLRAYRARSALMVALLVLAGVAEGVGVVTLIPLLEVVQEGERTTSRVGQLVLGVLRSVGLAGSMGVLLAVIVAAMTVKAAFLWTAYRQVGYTVARVTRDLRVRLIRALLRARWRYFGSRSPGSFANTVSSEALRAAWAYREACTVLADLFQIAVYVGLSLLISWRMTIVAVIAAGVLAFVLKGFIEMSRRAGLEQTRLSRSLSGRLVDVLQGIKPIKAMGREQLVLPLLEQETEGLNQAQRRQIEASQGLTLFQEPAVTLLLAGALYALLEVGNQPLEAVLVLAFVFYRLIGKVNMLQTRFQSLVVGESAYFSLMEQIDEAEAEEEDDAGEPVDGVREGIRIESVHFAYDPDHPVLRGVSLTIPAGAFIGIYGESGSGKTTLADLVLGLHRPDRGEVWIDDRPLGDLSFKTWRRRIGYVPQELLLFNDTILRNVTLGEESLTREDVERALRLAGAWEFVMEREKGVDTLIGEKGAMLSGGQRQRIAIARALVTRPSLLILDEVTTALDPATEQAICETLRGLRGRVTILSISHQPALREAADVAYLLRDGRLAGQGESAILAG